MFLFKWDQISKSACVNVHYIADHVGLANFQKYLPGGDFLKFYLSDSKVLPEFLYFWGNFRVAPGPGTNFANSRVF